MRSGPICGGIIYITVKEWGPAYCRRAACGNLGKLITKNCYITADSPVGVFVMTSARLLQALKPARWVNDRRSVSQSSVDGGYSQVNSSTGLQIVQLDFN